MSAVVVRFNCILDEEDMATSFVDGVVGKSQVMSTVHSESSVVTLMNSVTMSVRGVYCTDHMEMDSISSKFECLTHIGNLSVTRSSSQRVITFRMSALSSGSRN